ncbi:hypothetical protein ALI144C_32105 [Actinosynnema sp. ALI-1.44]|uniref:FAD-dependent monooxygenase n=1 Tax=Actinosynnema sp. ALI-1.44 TaxID=1933779 RepID=UPI00097BBECA|nr:FAD-dependent monooxygenase [Actinosynnema sp. ALI-1.44]ONI78032.1 hypothetical protein ALI144C_32105 [Actinosynnema sp. ALI-1.44]
MSPKDTQVLVAGCSLTGATAAVLLRHYGIRTLAVEQRNSVFPWPRTRIILGRPMEIYRTAGLEEQIRARPSQIAHFPEMARAETVAGPEWMRGEIEGLDEATAYGPAPWAPIDQHHLEPLLRARAEQLGARIECGYRLATVDQDEGGVRATVVDKATGATRTISADYLIAADGANSTVRELLGIGMCGLGVIGRYVNIVWEADITGPLRGRPVGVWFLDRPRPAAVIMPQDRPHRWILMVPHDPATGETLADFTEDRCRELVREAVGVPDMAVRIVDFGDEGVSPLVKLWEVGSSVAEEFRRGRVFLAGDAAHVMPPVGAFGANLGIQDVHNLAWKLALVLRGVAGPGLLDSYDLERVPVADATVGMATSHLQVRSEVGGKGNTTDGNVAVIFGHHYQSAAVLAENPDYSGELHHPASLCGEPGTRAPHMVLLHNDKQISSIDLYVNEFVLITGPDGQQWAQAGRDVAADLSLPLATYRIGDELVDESGTWAQAHRVAGDGAVLVRPDGFVAWRAKSSTPEPGKVLRVVLAQLLDTAKTPESGAIRTGVTGPWAAGS